MSYAGSYPAYAAPPPAQVGATSRATSTSSSQPLGTPYAIDFTAQAVGKTVAATKRRVRWRWGFASPEALSRGEKGPACRGEEHDITMVWSITSGKRQLTMDGKEVHYGVSKSGKLEFSWTTKGNNVLKVLAFANPPMSAQPKFRQYDLQINGQSFFEFPKMYELGMPRGSRAPPPYSASGYATGPTDDVRAQEEADIQRAIQASLQETHRKAYSTTSPAPAPPPAAPPASDLLDFAGSGDLMSAPNPGPSPAYNNAPQSFASPPTHNYAAPPTPTPNYGAPQQQPPTPTSSYGAPSYAAPAPSYAPQPGAIVPAYPPAPTGAIVPVGNPSPYGAPSSYGAPQPPPPQPNPYAPPPPQQQQHHQPPPPQTDTLLTPSNQSFGAPPTAAPTAFPFGVQQPIPPVDDPFAPKAPTQNEIHSAILGAYGPTDGAAPNQPMTPNGVPPQPNFQSPPGAFPPQQQQQPQAPYTNGSAPQSLSMAPLSLDEQKNENLTEVDSALKNLVNFDDISAPAAKDLKLTMVDEEEEKKKKKGKSKALPPVANNMVGSGATLKQIQQVKPEGTVKDPTKIMKPPPQLFSGDAVNAGALVVHGQGPPPLQPQGFGAGFRNNYY